MIFSLIKKLRKKMENFSYTGTSVPSDYKCANCKATNCKLWREYQTFCPQLLCAKCAIDDQKDGASTTITRLAKLGPVVADEQGMITDEHGFKCDQIGWYVPAVPTEDLMAYWGYTSVPQDGVDWWKRLPLREKRMK